jgi:hypothetical protein
MSEKRSFKPELDPEIAASITATVFILDVPSEVLLLQAFEDLKRQRNTQRRVTLEALEQCEADAIAALSRILMSEEDVQSQPIHPYLKRQLSDWRKAK